jgi:putative oxidoreductase
VTAAALLCTAVRHLHATSQPGSIGPQVIDAAAGVFLLIGLWTPVVGAVVASRELWIVFFGTGDPWLPLVLAILGATLAMIGPGSWSVDARLFGRKQFKRLR